MPKPFKINNTAAANVNPGETRPNSPTSDEVFAQDEAGKPPLRADSIPERSVGKVLETLEPTRADKVTGPKVFDQTAPPLPLEATKPPFKRLT